MKSLLHDLTHVSALHRITFFVLSDVFFISLSLFISFLVHFDFNSQVPYPDLLKEVLPLFIILKIASLALFRTYRITWRYVGVADLMNIIMAVVISQVALLLLSLPNSFFSLPITGLSKRIFLVDGFFTLSFIGALRISKRLYLEVIREKGPLRRGKRTLIVGAGNTGEMILRDMIRNGFANFYPIGFLDDERNKAGIYLHGVKILGATDKMESVIRRERAEAVIIAIPSLNHQRLRSLYKLARKLQIGTIKIVPRIYDYDKPDISLKGLEEISIEDLIGRQSIVVDQQGIRDSLQDKSVMITGAGGSIGMEIVMQVCAFRPRQMVLFDIDETELHNLGLRLARKYPHLSGDIHYVAGDVRDELRIEEVFNKYRPEMVFHAAAYKHVPMMEFHPREAVKVNIFGTLNVVRGAVKYGVRKFVMISTDKAVRPTSVMGATKRMAEFICRAFNEENGAENITPGICGENRGKKDATCFISVRFGNVLGSRGSVLPLFLEQIKHGGPLTVTDREMKRYFMTIPEAVSLVIQASILGKGGEVFVLDMGEPVVIKQIAEELIRLHGMEPYRDIDIRFIGLRPGEKLFE
ncbi:MAG TPA: nucleoside-diphosphate sugar epimerase/dehydratase, partial [Syntrophales bacterium]|nr:nucleoside-diphosphate sugar epimerase/dehydratase [Syntrophales bacterium]